MRLPKRRRSVAGEPAGTAAARWDDRAPETLCNRAMVVVRQCADQSGEAPGWPSIKPRGTTRRCQDTFLRNVLDDNAVGACGRCDNCMGNQYDATTDPRSVGADPQLHQAAANHHRPSEGVGGPVIRDDRSPARARPSPCALAESRSLPPADGLGRDWAGIPGLSARPRGGVIGLLSRHSVCATPARSPTSSSRSSITR